MIDRLKQPGGRFYLFALLLAGPTVWTMTILAVLEAFGIVAGVDYQAIGIGVSAVIGAVGLGSGASKYGSAQQMRHAQPDGEE